MVAPSTLNQIRLKFRRLTGALSSQQITNDQIDDYVNTFYQFDFPENLKLFANKGTFEFLTIPNVDQYSIVSQEPVNPVFNELVVSFDNELVQAQDVYYNFEPPVYIDNSQGFYFQSTEQFLKTYSSNKQEYSVSGNDSQSNYTITLPNTPILKKSVVLSATNSLGNLESFVDTPTEAYKGVFKKINQDFEMGTINYITGEVSLDFVGEIPISEKISFRFTPYKAGKTEAVCFHGNTLTLRPVPDKVYSVRLGAFLTPKALLEETQNPTIKQWWQYIAYGAAKKYFEDSRNLEGLQQIFRSFKEQERLILYRSIVQRSNQRTSTIYNGSDFYGSNIYGF